jgi:hypothetical protein
MVARLELGDVGPDFLDRSGALVAENRRAFHRVLVFQIVQIAVAQAGCAETHDDLAPTWIIDVDVLDLELARTFEQHGSLHGLPFSRVGHPVCSLTSRPRASYSSRSRIGRADLCATPH